MMKNLLRQEVKKYLSYSHDKIKNIFDNDEENSIVDHIFSDGEYRATIELRPVQEFDEDGGTTLQVAFHISDGKNELTCDLYYPNLDKAYTGNKIYDCKAGVLPVEIDRI